MVMWAGCDWWWQVHAVLLCYMLCCCLYALEVHQSGRAWCSGHLPASCTVSEDQASLCASREVLRHSIE
jgi:hypothetical protein